MFFRIQFGPSYQGWVNNPWMHHHHQDPHNLFFEILLGKAHFPSSQEITFILDVLCYFLCLFLIVFHKITMAEMLYYLVIRSSFIYILSFHFGCELHAPLHVFWIHLKKATTISCKPWPPEFSTGILDYLLKFFLIIQPAWFQLLWRVEPLFFVLWKDAL